MSKTTSDFERPDFIENVNDSDFTKNANQEYEEVDEPFVFTTNHALTIIVLYAGYLADNFIAELTHAINSTIVEDIGPAPNNNFFWILTIPTLVSGVLGPGLGKASDTFGRKYIQMGASIFGIISSAIAARTHSMKVLMMCSGLYGIAYAGHKVALTSIVEIFPRKHRPMVIAIFMAALLPATGFSPLIAAALTLHSSWRVVFWLALGLYVFSFVGTFLLYHPEKLVVQKTESLGKRLIQFDYIGVFLNIASIGTIAVGLIFGGTVFPWASVGTLVPTCLGIVMIFLFLAWIFLNRLRSPFIPRTLGLDFWSMILCIFFIGMVCSTTQGLWGNQVEILYTQKPLPLGLLTTPYGLAGCLFAPIAALLFFPKYTRWILTAYTTVLFVTTSAQAIVDTDTTAGSAVLTGFNGALHGATFVVTTAMVQLTVRHEHLGLATNLAFSAFIFGGVTYGIVDQVIVHNKLQEEAKALVVPALIKAGIPLQQLPVAVPAFLAGQITNPVFATASLPGLLAAGEALKEAYVHVFRYIYLVTIVFGGVMVISSVLQKNVYTTITSHVDVKLRSLRGAVRARKH